MLLIRTRPAPTDSLFSARLHTAVNRPWGSFETLALNAVVTVKIITVDPGHRLSLQRHTSRDEFWTALDVGLYAEVGTDSGLLDIGDRAWIPRGATHRVGNRGTAPARLVEVAFGRFDEADIERLEDDYRRVAHGRVILETTRTPGPRE